MKNPIQSIGFALLGMMSCAGAYAPPSAVVNALNSYRGYSEITSAVGSMDPDTYAQNMITWQMDHGGFCKAYASKYTKPWDQSTAKCSWTRNGVALGTFDNNATIQEMRFLAMRYQATSNATYKAAYKAAMAKAIDFILKSQPQSGGWPQVYPARGNYSDMATYNDNAMVRIMVLVQDIVNSNSPFHTDIISSTQRTQLSAALNKAVSFALQSQIVNNNVPTVWCAQHDPVSYAPVGARSYELASKSGSESAGVVWFLMNWPDQNAAIQKAVKGALNWYRKNRVADLKFSSGNFVSSSGASMWYRFYEVNNDNYFFCDREGESTKTQDITDLSDDRRYGYQWAGDYGSKLLSAEAAYLAALPTSSSSSSTPSSSSLVSSSSTPSSSSFAPSSSSMVSSSSEVVLQPLCGNTPCTTVYQGEDFCVIQGITESKNQGFWGSGYANAENHGDSAVGLRLNPHTTSSVTLWIRYANGGTNNRNASIHYGSQTLVPSLEFPSTGSWATWETVSLNVMLPAGNDSLVIRPLSAEGLPNVDWLGWNDPTLLIPSCQAPPPLSLPPSTPPLTPLGSFKRWDLMGRFHSTK